MNRWVLYFYQLPWSWFAKIVAWFWLLLAAFQLAVFTWKWLPTPNLAATLTAGATAVHQQPTPDTAFDISRYHLFGQYAPPLQALPVVTRPVVPVKPPLVLNIFGIIASDNPKRARVILSIGDRGTQEVYAVGEGIPKDYENKGLPKDAIVKKITADSITIQQEGVERVYYYHQGKTSAGQTVTSIPAVAVAPAFTSRTPPLPEARQRALLGEVSNRLQNNPASLRQFVRLSIYNEGNSMLGFKIYSRPGQEDYFRALGLEEEDIVTKINGLPLRSTQEAMQALNELTKATSVQMLVRRNGLELPVSIQLPQ